MQPECPLQCIRRCQNLYNGRTITESLGQVANGLLSGGRTVYSLGYSAKYQARSPSVPGYFRGSNFQHCFIVLAHLCQYIRDVPGGSNVSGSNIGPSHYVC